MSNFKQCPNGHYYQEDECPYCFPYSKEKEKLKSQLEDLRKDPPSFPPPTNAMCYCSTPPDWSPSRDNNDNKGNGWSRKVLKILAIIVAVAIVIAIVIALV